MSPAEALAQTMYGPAVARYLELEAYRNQHPDKPAAQVIAEFRAGARAAPAPKEPAP